ncbi:MAG: hypothetical protein HY821_12025 [Acidobacteria bacterium]|nr:hypothetical protein [Acidobacteriota bacterium]
MIQTTIHLEPPKAGAWRTGVSLHSHTSHSRESFEFIPRVLAGVPAGATAMARYEAHYRRTRGRELSELEAWWTPPLGPREALAVEREQIEALGLMALVSITDHDNIEAPLLLRVLSEGREVPISVEWSVPFRGTVFHLGVHNMGPRRARVKMAALERFTAEGAEPELSGLLDWLAEDEQTLIVFNHPYWDEKGMGRQYHESMAGEFLSAYRPWLHALELNGLRPWGENLRVLEMAEAAGLPAVSGGDRHGCEPNALLNLTMVRTFAEFVEVIRHDRRSDIVVMPQYREPMAGRVLTAVADVMRDNDRHTHGWARWSDRVFYRDAEGAAVPLSAAFEGGSEPLAVRLLLAAARALDHGGVQAAVRQLLQPARELPL